MVASSSGNLGRCPKHGGEGGRGVWGPRAALRSFVRHHKENLMNEGTVGGDLLTSLMNINTQKPNLLAVTVGIKTTRNVNFTRFLVMTFVL